jgi:hypothetical protein
MSATTLSAHELQELCVLQELTLGAKTASQIAGVLEENKWSLDYKDVCDLLGQMISDGWIQSSALATARWFWTTDNGRLRLDDLLQSRTRTEGQFEDIVESTNKFLDERYPEIGKKQELPATVNIQLSEDAINIWWNLLSAEEKGDVVSSYWESTLAIKSQLSFCGKDGQ